MTPCATCGNRYDKAFVIETHDGRRHTFDCFECAIHKLAPTCTHCGCRIIGHDLEADGQMFCCEHCARESGVHGLEDRV